MSAASATRIVNDHVENEVLEDAFLSKVEIDGAHITGAEIEMAHIDNSDITNAMISQSGISDSKISHAFISNAHVEESYVMNAELHHVAVSDSRVSEASLHDVTLEDATLCDVRVNGFGTDMCRLVSHDEDGELETHAWLNTDAPENATPGATFDIEVNAEDDVDTLTVENDPAGLTDSAFDPTASDDAVESIEVWVDGENRGEFGLGESFDLNGEDEFTLRVNVAEEGILDNSLLGLVLDLDGHGLRTGITMLDVIATELIFAPDEAQINAPFVADATGRLIATLPMDEFGNVDRDIGVSLTQDVKEVAEQEGTELVGDDHDTHGAVHGDSELFSENPIGYDRPTSEIAHRPDTLEMLLRDSVGLEGVTYGAANFHATHIVAIGPTETTVEYTAEATNAHGDELTAMKTVVLEPAPEDAHTETVLGEDFELPGRGMLAVNFVDADGSPVEAPEDAVLRIIETPESHNLIKKVHADGEEEMEVLPASMQVDLPFGNFVASEYQVCLMHNGGESCANEGDLIAIETGETTEVDIVIE